MGKHNILPSAEVLEALKADSDYPPSVKQELRLALRGGRQQKRRCLGCGATPALNLQLYVTYRGMSVAGEIDRKACTLYWVCDPCRGIGLTEELERKILETL
jgi:hypothetical protein